MKPVTQKLLSYIQGLSYGKVVRSALFLLLSFSILSTLQENPIHAAAISLIAFIAFDVVCMLKRPEVKDFSKEVAELQEKNADLTRQFKEVKSDLSVAKISTVIGQARK